MLMFVGAVIRLGVWVELCCNILGREGIAVCGDVEVEGFYGILFTFPFPQS